MLQDRIHIQIPQINSSHPRQLRILSILNTPPLLILIPQLEMNPLQEYLLELPLEIIIQRLLRPLPLLPLLLSILNLLSLFLLLHQITLQLLLPNLPLHFLSDQLESFFLGVQSFAAALIRTGKDADIRVELLIQILLKFPVDFFAELF